MKALIYEGERKLSLVERRTPEPRRGEVLLRVRACGICGSDVHGYLGITGRRIAGYSMGHEFSAEVAALGEGTQKRPIGQRVIVQPINACGHCAYCRGGKNNLCPDRTLLGVLDVQGAMAEYVCVPEKLLVPMADSCSFSTGALAEPFAVAYSAVEKVKDYESKTVLIIGAGMIGLCILEMLKIKGPEKIILSDLSEARLQRAKARGADEVINPRSEDYEKRIAQLTDCRMCDITFEAVGTEGAANQSIRALRKDGVSVWTGVSQHEIRIDMHDVVTCQRTIVGSMNYTRQEFTETVRLLESGRLQTEGLISREISLEQAAEYFEELHRNPDEYLKVMICLP